MDTDKLSREDLLERLVVTMDQVNDLTKTVDHLKNIYAKLSEQANKKDRRISELEDEIQALTGKENS